MNEEEIISSIKHRISQYVSPISNDIQSLEVYFDKKKKPFDRKKYRLSHENGPRKLEKWIEAVI